MDYFDDLTNDGQFGGHGDELDEDMDAMEDMVGLFDNMAVDALKVQSHKFCTVFPAQKLRRLVSVPYTLTSDYAVGEHGSLVRAAAELLPLATDGRVYYSLLNTAPRYETDADSSSFADMNQMPEGTNGPESDIAQRYEYFGSPKCPTVSPSSDIRPKGTFEPSTSTNIDSGTLPSTSVAEATMQNETGSEKQRILSLENEMKVLKEQLSVIAKLRGLDNGIDSAHGSPLLEPSTSGFSPAPPTSPVPLQVPFTKSPGGTPLFRRRRTGCSRFSGQNLDHGTLIAEALGKKFTGINGDQNPRRVSENRGDDEWNSSFGTPREEGDGRMVSINRVSRRSRTSTPQKMQSGDKE